MYRIYKKIENYDAIVIFGASDIGRLIEEEIRVFCEETGKTLCFADNSHKKWGQGVMSPEDCAKRFPGAVWIIASDRHNQSMFDDLLRLNINKSDIVRDMPAGIVRQKDIESKMRRISPQGVLKSVDIEIAHHCNLNCAGCNAFSPLIDNPVFADLHTVDRDLARLSYLLCGNVREINILGGEPLLNPEIIDFINSARGNFPNAHIRIITNGILLPKMQKEYWQACRENKIIVSVTRYPIDLNLSHMQKLADMHDVCFEFYGIAVEKTSWNVAFDPLGKQDPHESFTNCFYANQCAKLRNGKMGTCSLIQSIDFFNARFGTNMHAGPDDCIDIHEAKSGREILEFISHPVPFCRFCDVKSRTYDNPWHISRRKIGEWVANGSAGN